MSKRLTRVFPADEGTTGIQAPTLYGSAQGADDPGEPEVLTKSPQVPANQNGNDAIKKHYPLNN